MHASFFTGNLGEVPAGGIPVQHTPQGKAYCHISVAVNPPKGSSDPTIWYRCTFWSNVETAAKYAETGKPITVLGRLTKVHEWTDREGQKRFELQFSVSQWEYSGAGLSVLFKEAELADREVALNERAAVINGAREGGDGHRA
jgi:hypothetical protein